MLSAGGAAALGALSQSFTSDDSSIQAGTFVGLKNSGSNVVEKATSAASSSLLGVTADKPLVELGSGTGKVQVVISGLTPVLVSDINGSVKVGDKIAPSPIEGVGMKAKASGQIVGTAQSNLSSSQTTAETVKDKTGQTTHVKIGLVSVQVGVMYYDQPHDKLSSFVPPFIVSLASTIAGHDLSPSRALISFCILVLGFIIAAIMLQAGVRSGIISIGRNPLAHSALRRSLLDVLATAFGVLLVSAVVFYLILTI